MFDAVLAWVTSNPILVGGVGTVLFGSALYLLKAVPKSIYSTARKMMTIEFFVTSEEDVYHDLVAFLASRRYSLFSRNYGVTRGDVTTGYGPSMGAYKGRLILFQRQVMDNKMYLYESLNLTIFTRNSKLLQSLVDESKKMKDLDSIKVYVSGGGHWGESSRKRKRNLDTVFCNGKIKHDVVKEIKWFYDNEDWYRRRGIPYKKVFLLSGPPGVGKSSLIYAVASKFDHNVASLTNITSIGRALTNLPERSFVAIEDIDMLSISREDDDDIGIPAVAEKEKMSALSALHHLINTLDGLATPEGLVVFITTNFKDRLDPALIRPGRIDHDIEIGPLNAQATEEMFVSFYGDEYRYLIRGYTTSRHFIPQTGAECQRVFMACKSANEAVHELHRREGEIVHRLETVSG